MQPGARTPGVWVTRTRGAAALGLAAVTTLGLGVADRAGDGGPDNLGAAGLATAASDVPPGFGHESRLPLPPPTGEAVTVTTASPARPVQVPRASRQARPIEEFLPAWVPPVIDSTGIPVTVLKAYRNAKRIINGYNPACNLSTALLGAIGRVESDHAFGGYLDKHGKTLAPILGPRLDGHPGVKSISDSDGGLYDGDKQYDRAVGPMQFIPTTWVMWAADGNGDKRGDPNNVFDAALSAGWYLCHGGADLKDPKAFKAAVLRYNGSEHYYKTVKAWTAAYMKALNPVPDTKDAGEAQRKAAEKAAAERAAAAATARAAAAAKQRAAVDAAAAPADRLAPVAPGSPVAPALEPAADGGTPAETPSGRAAPGTPIVPRAPRAEPAQPRPVQPQPAPQPMRPAPAPAKPAGEAVPSTDERRDQKPAGSGEAVGSTLNGLTRPKGGVTPSTPAAPPRPARDVSPTPPPTGVPLR